MKKEMQEKGNQSKNHMKIDKLQRNNKERDTKQFRSVRRFLLACSFTTSSTPKSLVNESAKSAWLSLLGIRRTKNTKKLPLYYSRIEEMEVTFKPLRFF